ncbi:MAG: RagB/SusD family nutrient uptake outer membrane protein, partial [Paludibacter sp.]
DRGPYLSTEVIAEFLDDKSTGSWLNNRYNDVYSSISRLNTILARIDASEMTEDEKNSVVAETLFLRAFYYFDLVQHWGPVPLMLNEVTNESDAFQPNSTVEDIYKQIIDDVTKSIQLGLPTPQSFPQSGRATQGAAKMLLAYAYMTKPTKEYTKAETELKDITKMNYGLLDNYADAFSPTNKNSKESIFEVQYIEGEGGQNSDFAWRMIPKCSNTDFLMGVSANNYAYTSGGWNVPTQEMIDSYEEGDNRLNASIAVTEGSLNGEQFTADAVKDVAGYVPETGKAYFYFVRKYYHPPYSQGLNTGDNFPVYRYSGTLLLLAECLVEENKAAEALPYINQVRVRAGLDPLTVVTRENVANEMRHELAFENHRWTDLVRTGKAIEVMSAFGVEMKKLHPWLLPTSFNVTQNKLIYPFNFRELDVNKNLIQNPGY